MTAFSSRSSCSRRRRRPRSVPIPPRTAGSSSGRSSPNPAGNVTCPAAATGALPPRRNGRSPPRHQATRACPRMRPCWWPPTSPTRWIGAARVCASSRPCSARHDAGRAWSGVGQGFRFLRTAKGKNAGGTGPRVRGPGGETLPDAGFASITDTTPEKLQELSQAGYVLCGTMNTG